MNEDYTVAIKLSLINDVSKGLVSMAAQFSVLQKQADIFKAKLAAIRSTAIMGGMLLGAGAAMAAPLILATKMAGNLQQELVNIQLATHASNKEMENFRSTVEQTGTIFTSVQVARIGKMLAMSGSFSMKDLSSLTQQFAQFATVQKQLKGTDYEKSTEMGIKLAEITGHFDPNSMKASLDAFTKLSLLMPGSVDKVLKAFSYAEGTMKNVMGVSDEDTMLMVAMLQRMGIQGTRTGSQLLAMVSRTIPQVMGSGLWEGKSAIALKSMGLLDAGGKADVFTNGKFDTYKFFGKISNYVAREFQTHDEKTARNDIMQNFQFAWGTTGSRLASLFTTKQGLGQLAEIQKQYTMNPDLNKTYEKLKDTFNVQLSEATANISTMFTELGMSILPMATGALKYFNTKIMEFTAYLKSHQSTVEFFEKTILTIAGLTAAGGTLLLFKAALSGLLIPLQMMTTTIPALATGMLALSSPAWLVIGAIGAISVGLYELYKNGYITKDGIKNLTSILVTSFVPTLDLIKTAAHVLNVELDYLAKIMLHLSKAVSYAVSYVDNEINKLLPSHNKSGKLTTAGKVENGLLNIAKPTTNQRLLNTISPLTSPFTAAYRAAKELIPSSLIPSTYFGDNNIDQSRTINNKSNPITTIHNKSNPITTIHNKPNPITTIHNKPNQKVSYDVDYFKKSLPNKNEPKYDADYFNSATTPANNNQTPQIIHVHSHIYMDGEKIHDQVIQTIVNKATNTPNNGSLFDTSLSPMPTNVNVHGVSY
jgi:TP901 family phage tail tape measure protein